VAATLAATCHSFISPYPEAQLAELRGRIEKAIGKRLRRQLETVSLELSDRPIDPARWAQAMDQSEDRLALTLCGDVRAAAAHIHRVESGRPGAALDRSTLSASAGPRLRQLLAFAISEEQLTLRERLGTAVVE
jgi:hypothetical protein